MEKKWNRMGKRLLSCALTILLAAQAAPMAYAIDTQENGSNSDTQISSPVEIVYANSYGGNQRSTDFNEHWKFNLGDASGAEASDYDDSAWRDVNLPHDYSIEQPYSASNEAESGYLPGGVGWYRKHFTIDSSWQTKRVSINFDGAYMNTEVYLNGTKLGFHPYGYTPFSLELPADLLEYGGENVIAVKTNNKIPSSRWYSGSGIYRDVTLVATDPVHIVPNGITVLTPDIESGTGTVKVTTEVANDGTAEVQGLTVSHTITEKGSEQSVASGEGTIASISNGTSQSVEATATVASPKLWNVWDKGEQNLYVVHTEIKKGDQVLDSYDTTFGFRYFDFTQQGFSLNGENMKLRGVCMHHDQGALGAEAWYRATERQVEIMKEMGCNAIRVTHNPASQVLLDICNEQGMLVVEEAFDTWTQQKNYNTNDYSAWFETVIEAGNNIEGAEPGTMTWAEYDVKAMVNRGKNHPCIIMWSLGNEILETTQYDFSKYPQHAQSLINWVQEVDETRPVTFGDNKLKDGNGTAKSIAKVVHDSGGVVGYNYATNQQMTNNSEAAWLIYGSETASAINSSGVYNYIGNGGQTGNQRLTSYDTSKVGWGAVASDAWYRAITMDRNAGEFVWTGFDYIGEPTPWNGTSSGSQTGNFEVAPKSSYFGIVDTTGFPKDSFYLYQSLWNDQVNTLHILPTWNEEDVLQENGKVRVVVYSDAAEIKLYLNEKEVGTAKATENGPSAAGYVYSTFTEGTGGFQKKTGHESLYATFLIPYEKGTLRAEAYDKDGHLISESELQGRTQVKTTEPASQLSLSADRTSIKADGKDLSYITIDVTDRNGELVNGAEPTITLDITGDGKIIGVDSGAQFDHTSNQSLTWKAFHGKLLAIVQSTTNDGEFTVTARADADGMVSDSITVQTTPVASSGTEKTVSSLEYSRTYYVKVGNEPVLPSTIKVNYSDGTSDQKTVTWSGTGNTQQAGSFTKTGTIEGITTTASVRIVMLESVAALMNYSCAVAVGTAANLPATRPAITAEGEVLDAYFPVTWDPVNTDEAGLYPVKGHASVFGEDLTLTAMVRVSEGEVHTGSNMAPRVVELYHGTESDKETGALRVICDEDTNAANYWSGQGEVRFRYDTAQNINEVKLYLKDTAPSSRDMHLEWSPDGSSWTKIDADISNEAGAGMTIRSYSFDIVSAVWIKLVFDTPVNLVEAELNTGIPSFAIGREAALSSLNVKGRIADQNALDANLFGTPDTDVTLEDITAVGADNASVTLLPPRDKVIRILMESEDHAEQATFQILLGNSSGLVTDPTSDKLDYDRTKTTASAGSENADNSAHTEGPASYAVDGDSNTIWHSNWDTGAGDADLSDNPELRWFMLTLQEATEINALRYLPRQGGDGGSNGRVKNYKIEVSTTSPDGPWETVAEGSWANTDGWKIAPFTKTVSAKYVRLSGVNTYGDTANKFMSAAEIRVCKPASDLFLLADATLPQEAYDYTGQAITPEPTVTLKDGGALVKDTDYTVSYANNTEPGTATVTIRGTGIYTGILQKTFTINAVDIDIKSYEPITVNTGKGVAPQLPGTVTANMSAGEQRVFEVVWADIDPSRYEKLGEFDVYGTVLGQTLPATAHVVVSGITGVEGLSLVTMPGVAPTLPTTVKVYLSNDETSTAKVEWEQKEYTGSADTIIPVTGTVEGTDLKATASVRLADMTESNTNLALNDDVSLDGNNGDLPLAIAWVSAGQDNPFKATNGQKNFASDGSKVIWSDWESGTYHMDQNWLGVILGSGDAVESRLLHKVSVGFMEEDGGSNKVSLPASYKIEYYVGPEKFDYQTTLSKESAKNQGNGFVRNWSADNPLKDVGNWKEVTYTGSGKPAVPSNSDFKKMIDITFEPVETQIIRISLTPQANQWVGIEEFEAYGYDPVTLHNSFDVSSIQVDSQEKLSEFSGNTLNIKLDADAPIPTVTASATNNASVTVVQAYDRNSTAKVIFKAEDGTGEQTYSINFTADEATVHPVQYQLYHLTADPKPIDVADGQALQATLQADAEYQLPDAIQVRMGGKVLDVGTGYTYDKVSGQVEIASVTGDVVIIADAIQTGSVPTITTTALDNGKVNTPYYAMLAATGDAPITWSISSGDLPTGLSLAENGLISGTPKAEGNFTFTVTATNQAGQDSKTLSIQVENEISSEKEIRSFNIDGGGTTISGTQITVTMPHGTDVTSLIPTITVSDKASVSPASGVAQDFSSPVTYRVTAEDGSTQDYTVRVEVAAQGVYIISADTVANGIIRTSASSAAAGDSIDVTLEPDSGYAVKEGSLKVYKTGEPETTVPLSGESFVMPEYNVTVTAEFKAVEPAFVAVQNITGIPVEAKVGVPLTLGGTVIPSNATNRQIVWRVTQAGSTGASIQNDVLSTTDAGVAILTATIADGKAPGVAYTQDFTIAVVEESQTYVVEFKTNGGSSVSSQQVKPGEKASRPEDPVRSRYRFTGWYLDENCTVEYDFNAPVTGNLTLYAGWSYTGSSSSTGDQTKVEHNSDGSTTTTVTKPDGTVTETTKYPDGSKEVVQTKPNGSMTITRTEKDGSSSVTKVDKNGQVETEVKVSQSAVDDAHKNGENVVLPMPSVPNTSNRHDAPTVTVDLPGSGSVKVEIPVEDATSGTVAVLVKANGSEEVIKTTQSTKDSVIVTLHDGDTVKIVDNSKTFVDVSQNFWAHDYVKFVTSRELFSGTSNNTFSPDEAMTRAMIVTVLARFEGVDTSKGEIWYDVGRQWAMEKRISDGSDMEGHLTREQLATMLYRYVGEPAVSGSLRGFTDASNVSDYAQRAMVWAVEQGLISGVGNNRLDPQGQATRAQVAAILARFINKA